MSINKKEIFCTPYNNNHQNEKTVDISSLPVCLFHKLHVAEGTYMVNVNFITVPLNDNILQAIMLPEHAAKMYVRVYRDINIEPEVFVVSDENTAEEILCVLSKEQKDVINEILLVEAMFGKNSWVRSKMG